MMGGEVQLYTPIDDWMHFIIVMFFCFPFIE